MQSRLFMMVSGIALVTCLGSHVDARLIDGIEVADDGQRRPPVQTAAAPAMLEPGENPIPIGIGTPVSVVQGEAEGGLVSVAASLGAPSISEEDPSTAFPSATASQLASISAQLQAILARMNSPQEEAGAAAAPVLVEADIEELEGIDQAVQVLVISEELTPQEKQESVTMRSLIAKICKEYQKLSPKVEKETKRVVQQVQAEVDRVVPKVEKEAERVVKQVKTFFKKW